MTLLRFHAKAEWEALPCDPWERCPKCKGRGQLGNWEPPGPALVDCPDCDGYGSARAMALAKARWQQGDVEFVRRWGNPPYRHMSQEVLLEHARRMPEVAEAARTEVTIRCEDCAHPMSEGTWPWSSVETGVLLYVLRAGDEPSGGWIENHDPYSPCDEGCRHGGPVRQLNRYGREGGATYNDLPPGHREGFEASWRQVDARRLSWDHDLRPEQLAVLCLRCLAGR